MKILRSAARPRGLPSPYPLFPLFPKSKRRGSTRRQCTHPGRVGAPLPFAQGLLRKAKPRGQGPAGGD